LKTIWSHTNGTLHYSDYFEMYSRNVGALHCKN